jgi:Sap-like sulfolipid-1-addressing protein
MGVAIGEVLAPAMGVALDPIPVIIVILILLSPKARWKGVAYVIGALAGLTIGAGTMLLLADPAHVEYEDGGPSTTASVLQLIIGVVLIGMAAKQWFGRPKDADEPKLPSWMASFESMSPIMAFGIGAFLFALDPKHLIFNVAAATAIASSDASTAGDVVALVVYLLLGTVTISGPVIWHLVAPGHADRQLVKARVWLMQNTAIILTLLFFIIGVVLIGSGITGLSM